MIVVSTPALSSIHSQVGEENTGPRSFRIFKHPMPLNRGEEYVYIVREYTCHGLPSDAMKQS